MYVIPIDEPLSTAVPFCGVVIDVMFSGFKSKSISFSSTLMSASCMFLGVLTTSSMAVGGAFTSLTVSVNVSESCNGGMLSSVTFTVISYVPTSVNPGSINIGTVSDCNEVSMTKARPLTKIWSNGPTRVTVPSASTLCRLSAENSCDQRKVSCESQ